MRDRYRAKAFDCIRAAKTARDPFERIELLEIAQYWLKLAEHVALRFEGTREPRTDARSGHPRS